MCGMFCCFSKNKLLLKDVNFFDDCAKTIEHRGRDASSEIVGDKFLNDFLDIKYSIFQIKEISPLLTQVRDILSHLMVLYLTTKK